MVQTKVCGRDRNERKSSLPHKKVNMAEESCHLMGTLMTLDQNTDLLL